MNFLDGALFPENQEKLVITASPYGPEWQPRDFPEDIAVSMKDQVQKAKQTSPATLRKRRVVPNRPPTRTLWGFRTPGGSLPSAPLPTPRTDLRIALAQRRPGAPT